MAVFPSVAWQRCQFHLSQNAQSYAPKKSMRAEIGEVMREIFNSPTLEFLQWRINSLSEWKRQSIDIVTKSFEKTAELFIPIYDECIKMHKHPTAIYERGRIFFDRGDTLGFISNIFSLIEMGYVSRPEMDMELGRAYNDANLYDHAIKVLSEAISKNPKLKDAYLERAIAFFETGNLTLALDDYLNYGGQPNFLKDINHKYFKFNLGIGIGCMKGGADSAIDFVPNLLSTVFGLGKGLWALAADPIGISKELLEETITCVDYIKANLTPELVEQLMPEIKECVEKWDQLGEEERGYYIGYVIGRYGVDALICGGTGRAIQIYRNIKRANAQLTLEAAKLSSINAKALAKASEEFFILRSEFKKKCKVHIGQQEKHIPGANNFQAGKSELTVSLEKLEQLASRKLGEGVPARFTFGEAGYREIIDFEEKIGVHVHKETKIRTPTTVGEIHYDKDGRYHIVPVHPDRLKIKK